MFFTYFFVIVSVLELASSSPALLRSQTVPGAPNATEPASFAYEGLDKRQDVAPVITCGYSNGNPESSRTADPGYGCRVDTANGLWGFCPTSVISAKDCGLAGICVDSQSCTNGCGRLSDQADITTISCEPTQFCSNVLLINGPDQSFEYIACGEEARTDSLFAVPNGVEATITSSSNSFRSTSSASPSSQAMTSVTQTSRSLASGSSILLGLSSPSSTSTSTSTSASAPSEQKSTNIGAIVGGVVGGLTVICLTILGVLLIRRKRGATEKAVPPPDYKYNDQNDLANNTELSNHDPRYIHKGYHWDSSHGPVEMHGGPQVSVEPVELPVKVQATDYVTESK